MNSWRVGPRHYREGIYRRVGRIEDILESAVPTPVMGPRRVEQPSPPPPGGADVEVKSGNGAKALHRAILGGHIAITRLLSEKGTDLDARGASGKTALYLAAVEYRRGRKARLLLKEGTT